MHKWSRVLETHSGRDAMEMSVQSTQKMNVLVQAKSFADSGMTIARMRESPDPYVRRYANWILGAVSPEAWDLFVAAGGDLFRLRETNPLAALDLNAAFHALTIKGVGKSSGLTQAGQLAYHAKDRGAGILANLATTFSTTVANIGGAQREWLRQSKLEGIDELSQVIMLNMAALVIYGGAFVYLRDYLAQNKKTDPTEWDAADWLDYSTRAISYSTIGGLFSDFAAVGARGLGRALIEDETRIPLGDLAQVRFPGGFIVQSSLAAVLSGVNYMTDNIARGATGRSLTSPDLVGAFGEMWRQVGISKTPLIRTPASYLVSDYQRAARDTLLSQFSARPPAE